MIWETSLPISLYAQQDVHDVSLFGRRFGRKMESVDFSCMHVPDCRPNIYQKNGCSVLKAVQKKRKIWT